MKLIRTVVPVLLMMCAQAFALEPHPRLLFGANDLAELRARRLTTHTNEWQNMIRLCEFMKEHTEYPSQTMDTSRDVRQYHEWLLVLALVQLIDPAQPYDPEFADFFLTMLRYETWDETPIWGGYDLVVGHFLLALALAYDWHYDDFTSGERTEIRERLASYTDRALADLNYLADNPTPAESDARRFDGNHLWINFAGVAAVHYALQGEIDESRRQAWEARLDQGFSNVCRFLVRDGSGMEGNSYHSYGLVSFERWMELRRRGRGEPEADFYKAIPWFTNTSFFTLYSIEPGGDDNYGGAAMFGDTTPYHYVQPSDFEPLLAARLHCPYAQWLATKSDYRIDWETYQTVWPYLWRDATLAAEPPDALPRWRHFSDYGLFTWRSSWSNDATYFSLKSGKHIVGHGHPDDGNFILGRAGVPYLVDLGYSFKKQTEEHNVLLVNGSGQYGAGSTWDATSPSSRWGRITSVIADDRSPAGSAGFFDAVCDPKATYTNAALTSWVRETVGLGDLLLLRDTVSAGSSVRFDLLLHGIVIEPSDGLYDFASHRTVNPWTSLGGGRWSLAPDASRSTEPALVVADLSAGGAWAATNERTMFVPEQIPGDAGGGYNDAANAYQFGWNLRRSLTTMQGRSLVAMGFNDQINGWTISPWGYSGAEGARVTSGGAAIASVLWPDGNACSGSGGWDIRGAMAGRRYARAAGDPLALYFGRDVTWVRDNGLELLTSTAPVSVYSRMEHAADDDPHQARLAAKAPATITLYCPTVPGGISLNGISAAFSHDGGRLTFTLPAAGTYDLVVLEKETLPPLDPPVLACSTDTLAASVTQGLHAASQSFGVWNAGGGEMAYSADDDAAWLAVSPSAGSSAGEVDTLTVEFDTALLAAGTYTATLTVTAPDAGPAKTISVALTVQSPPPPQVSPTLACTASALTASVTQGMDAAIQSFALWNAGDGEMAYSVSDDASWLTVSPSAGSSAGELDGLTVSFSTASLNAGTHAATITVTAPGAVDSPRVITVTLSVLNSPPPPIPPALACSVSALAASVMEGADAAGQAFEVWNTGDGELAYEVSDDAGWLAVNPSSGTSAGEHDALTVTFSTASLNAGNYAATITVIAPGAVDSPRVIPVTLSVLSPPPPPIPPALACSASALTASVMEGADAAGQAFEVWNAGDGELAYEVSDDAGWLAVNPSGGTSAGEHDALTVTFSTASLAAGTYTAAIVVTAPGAVDSPRTIAVTLTVENPPPPSDVNVALASRGTTISGSNGGYWSRLIDGVSTGYTGGSGFGYTYWKSKPKSPGYIQMDLKATHIIRRMRLLLWDLDKRYYRYKVEYAASAGGPWKMAVDRRSGENRGWQDVELATPVRARYLRLTGTYNSANTGFHVVEWEAYESPLAAAPFLLCSTASLTVAAAVDLNPPSSSFTVCNGGLGTLTYSISSDAPWLSVTPAAASSTETAVTHTVSFDTASLPLGTYSATITVTPASGPPQLIPVTLNVEKPPPEVDLALASSGSTITGSNGGYWSRLIDNVNTGYNAGSGFGYTLWNKAGTMTLDLKSSRRINRMRLLLWDGDTRYYQYKIEYSDSPSGPWTLLVNRTTGENRSWQDLPLSCQAQARYLRLTGTYNSANTGFHAVEWEVLGY